MHRNIFFLSVLGTRKCKHIGNKPGGLELVKYDYVLFTLTTCVRERNSYCVANMMSWDGIVHIKYFTTLWPVNVSFDTV